MIRSGGMAVAALVLLASVSWAKSDGAPPADLVGTWDVERVEVDRADQMHWGVKPDDPQLVGRELAISSEGVHFTAEKEGCKQSRWSPLATTWKRLFEGGFLRAPGGGRSTHPKPADFQFVASGPAQVKAYLLCPDLTHKRADAWMQDKWIALQATDTLAMHYSNQVLLILKRRPADAAPRASFPCEKAVTPTEKAICASFQLAGWDRSMSAAWRAALERAPEKQAKLHGDQKEWLQKRDACGADVHCIDDLLWRRVDELVQE
jgi:uncharacterized protein YecT (DUF1311 family)